MIDIVASSGLRRKAARDDESKAAHCKYNLPESKQR
jgi:hypothetical protein